MKLLFRVILVLVLCSCNGESGGDGKIGQVDNPSPVQTPVEENIKENPGQDGDSKPKREVSVEEELNQIKSQSLNQGDFELSDDEREFLSSIDDISDEDKAAVQDIL